MKLLVGQKLHSVLDSTALVVIRAPDSEVTVTCGEAEMGDASPDVAPVPGAMPDAGPGDGAQLGKRYADEGLGLELLCVKGGDAPVAVDGTPLRLKDAKPLPASD